MRNSLIKLLIIFLLIPFSLATYGKEQLNIKLTLYNLTDINHQLESPKTLGISKGRGVVVKPLDLPKLKADVTSPVIVSHSIQEKGRMYRFSYRIKANKLSCTVDFMAWWSTNEGRYIVTNLHTSPGGNYLCVASPVKLQDGKAAFSVALANKP